MWQSGERCIHSATSVVARMHRCWHFYRLTDHLGQKPAKLVSTPSLHRVPRSWRELYAADRAPESRACAVWDVSALPFAGAADGDCRHIAALVFHLYPVRVRMVRRADTRRARWPHRRDVVAGDACPSTTVIPRRRDVCCVPRVWRAGAGAHADDDVVPLLPLPLLRAHLVRGEAGGTARGGRVAIQCRGRRRRAHCAATHVSVWAVR